MGVEPSEGVTGQPLAVRHHRKADGRSLRLYGRTRHDLPPLAEEGGEASAGGSLRWHPLRREWVVYAAHRQNRTYKPSRADDPLAAQRPDGPFTEIPFADFEVAIFDNKFPSLAPAAPLTGEMPDGIEAKAPRGACEVVVYTPEPEGSLHTIGQARRELLLDAWTERYLAHREAGRLFVMPFESRGEEVGVTLHHPHGQIYAFDVLPPVQANMAVAFGEGYRLDQAMRGWDDYLVVREAGVTACCPPYARFPFEVWIVPEARHAGPWTFCADEARGFAKLLGDMTRRYDAYFERPTAYMLSLQASPRGYEEGWHFTAQFYPILRSKEKVKFLASVEQASGLFTVDVLPERAAQTLRELD